MPIFGRREPAVAGQFYPGTPEALRHDLASLIERAENPCRALGLIAPHAGYIYSGRIAGQTFGQVQIPDTVLILGPNHHGLGAAAALYAEGSWRTPMGDAAIDSEFASALLQQVPGLTSDPLAHRLEHSLEVEVPFIQYLSPRSKIVPLCLRQQPLPLLVALGEALGEFFSTRVAAPLMVASSDMTHYETGEAARSKDMAALERVLALDPEGLYRTVRDRGITMCGVIPVVVMLAAARKLGATEAVLVRYGNSGDVTGDQAQVVGYAGVVVR